MTARFGFIPTPLAGLFVVERRRLEDERGFFSRFFCAGEMAEAGLPLAISQMNHTLTRRRGAARGLHFQRPPHGEDKYISCLRGSVFDVTVDLRHGSPTFLHWHAEILSAANARSIFVPKGFAHGFQALEDDCELLYLHSHSFVANAEGALSVRDKRLAIDWPLPITELSARDSSHADLTDDFTGLRI